MTFSPKVCPHGTLGVRKCLVCKRTSFRKLYKNNQSTRANIKQNKDWRFYCLVPGDREKIWEAQGGMDPISGEPLTSRANVDHRHSDGLIRGLLNWRTNKNLEVWESSDKGQFGVISSYLSNPPAVAALGGCRYGVIGRVSKLSKNRRYGPEGTKDPFHTKESL